MMPKKTKAKKVSSGKKPKRKVGKRRPVRRSSKKPPSRDASAGSIKKEFKVWVAKAFNALDKAELNPVLIGEACAAAYAPRYLIPKTINFVIERTTMPKLGKVLSKVGFRRKDTRLFRALRCNFDLIISPPPLAVGDELVQETTLIIIGGTRVRVLTPTDCVRHRLAHFYRWGSQDALDQAAAVAKSKKVDLDVLRRWSEWEWADDRFAVFLDKMSLGEFSISM